MTKLRVGLLLFIVLISACENKSPQGFGLEGASIRYQTKSFEDPETLAVVNGQVFTKSQILDKSPVLKDLALQEQAAKAGLAYLKVVERLGDLKPLGQVEIFLPQPKMPFEDILARFGRKSTPGLGVSFKENSDSEVIAVYKDIRIHPDELNSSHVVMQSLEQRRFQEVASQLNGQLSRILISEHASKNGIDMQSFLHKEVFGGKEVSISDAELHAYLQSIGFSLEELTEELVPRFQDSMKLRKQQTMMEEYVAKNLLKGQPIDVAFDAPSSRLALNENWKPVLGYKDAPVSLVAFSGSTCPDCSGFISAVRTVMKKYDGHLKLNWIHNFNDSDGIAKMMAEAALCVDRVKPRHSVDFLAAFAKDASHADENGFYQWAESNGIDSTSLKKCLVEKSNNELVSQHLDYSRKVGIVANPTIWVEGRTLQGVVSSEQLEKLIDESIRTKGSGKLAALWRRIKFMVGI